MTTGVAVRLKEIRLRSGKNQQLFAAMAGVSRNSQVEYEAGKTAPNTDYLVRLGSHGIDVGYVVTGRRVTDSLSDRLSVLAGEFDQLSPDWQDIIIALIRQASGSQPLTDRQGAGVQ